VQFHHRSQHREALQKCHCRVQEQVAFHGVIQCDRIILFQRLLHAAQAGGGAAAPGIAGDGVVVVQLALCPAAGEIALIEVVEILFVLLRVDAQLFLYGFVQTPADIIVAVLIVHEPAVFRQGVEGIQLRFQHRLTMVDTQVDHGGHVVEQCGTSGRFSGTVERKTRRRRRLVRDTYDRNRPVPSG